MSGYYHQAQQAKHLASEDGFTLIEVLIVVGIMALSAALAVPNWIQGNARYQLRQAATELQGVFSLARMAAMNQNTTVIATPSVAGGQLTVTFTNPNGATVMSPFTESIREITNVTGGAIQFNSLGLRVGGPAGVQIVQITNRDGVIYSVEVTPGGKVRWCASTGCS